MLQIEPKIRKEYARGSYNKFDDVEQWIRISEGCPNNCIFCRETVECGKDPIYLPIPKIVRNQVKILDMNFIYKPKALQILKDLGSRRVNGKVIYYEFKCGIDYRYLTFELAHALKDARFINIRISWDFSFGLQRRIKKAIDILVKAGYKSKDITVFMICNWLITYEENCRKIDLCKVWNVKCADCYFDNQLSPNIKPIHWNHKEIKSFRDKVRTHDQMVNFGIDPEWKDEYFRKKEQTTLDKISDDNKKLNNVEEK